MQDAITSNRCRTDPHWSFVVIILYKESGRIEVVVSHLFCRKGAGSQNYKRWSKELSA